MRLLLATLCIALLSGCVDNDDPTTDSADAAAAEVATPELTVMPVDWAGSLGYQAASCAVVTCAGFGYGNWDNTKDIRGVRAVSLELEWESANNLGLSFGLATSCDQGCDFVKMASGDPGDSPLELQVEGLDLQKKYMLVVWHTYQCAANCMAGVQGGQETPFSVTGDALGL